MRIRTSCTTPASPATVSSRSISVIESARRAQPGRLDGRQLDRFVVAVEGDSPRPESRHAVRPPARRRWPRPNERPSSSTEAGDLAAQERLGGVVHIAAAAECGDLAAAAAEVVLVDDEQRVPYWRQVHRDPGDAHHAVGRRIRLRGQMFGARSSSTGLVSGGRGGTAGGSPSAAGRPGERSHSLRRGHPENAGPLAITWRVASHRARRARCRSVGFLVAHRQHPAES